MKKIVLLFQIVLLVVATPVLAAKEGYHSVSGRDGAEQPFWLIEPDNASHIVILFPGGKGNIGISEQGIGSEGNFLVRTRQNFAKHGFITAVIDVPSDRKKLFKFRKTKKHAKDIKAVMIYLRNRHPGKPLWLVGTSRGTISVANVASRITGKQVPDGIVLTSSVTRKSKKGLDSLEDINLSAITAPTYIVHHKNDSCKVTPFKDIPSIMDSLSSVSVKEMKSFTGGWDTGKPCKGQSHHGFLGIEDKVVDSIAGWIKAH